MSSLQHIFSSTICLYIKSPKQILQNGQWRHGCGPVPGGPVLIDGYHGQGRFGAAVRPIGRSADRAGQERVRVLPRNVKLV